MHLSTLDHVNYARLNKFTLPPTIALSHFYFSKIFF